QPRRLSGGDGCVHLDEDDQPDSAADGLWRQAHSARPARFQAVYSHAGSAPRDQRRPLQRDEQQLDYRLRDDVRAAVRAPVASALAADVQDRRPVRLLDLEGREIEMAKLRRPAVNRREFFKGAASAAAGAAALAAAAPIADVAAQ